MKKKQINIEVDKYLHDITINGTYISPIIFEKEFADYKYELKEDIIIELKKWINTQNFNDTNEERAMKEDLEYLKTIEDNYVYVSQSNNEYIAQSDNPKKFKEITQTILEIQKVFDFCKNQKIALPKTGVEFKKMELKMKEANGTKKQIIKM